MSDEARDAFALEITSRLVESWSATIGGMPPVCTEGQQCRDETFADLMVELKKDFNLMLSTIDFTFSSGKLQTRTAIDAAY